MYRKRDDNNSTSGKNLSESGHTSVHELVALSAQKCDTCALHSPGE